MNRLPAILLIGALAGCAGHPAPRTAAAPAPSSAQPSAAIVASGPAPTDENGLPPAPQIDTTLDLSLDLAQERQLEADSAADAAVLRQLADDSSADDSTDTDVAMAAGGIKALAAGGATWDIDVATYGTHDRVQYWLDFFEGPARERMGIWLTRLPRYEPMIRASLQEHGLPTDLVYLALIESGYSNSAVSPASATGMWQFMRGTARSYGLRVDGWVDERRDPIKATRAAADYLSDLYKQFGSFFVAAAAYNAGGGSIARSLRRMPDDSADSVVSDATFFRLYDTRLLHRETADYVPKLIAAALIAKEPERYGFSVPDTLGPFRYDSLVVHGMVGLDVAAKLAHTTVTRVRELNPEYLKLVTPPDVTSVIRLPAGTGPAAVAGYAVLPANRRVSFVHYKVRRGETLSGIAVRFRVSQNDIMSANPRVHSRRLRIGQTLVIPTSGGISPVVVRSLAQADEAPSGGQQYHKVRHGESLWVIAQRYEVSEQQLRAWNHLGRRSTIFPGQRLRIAPPRGGAAPKAPRSPSVRASRSTGSAAPVHHVRTHVVRKGETLTGLARRYGVSLQALSNANGLKPSAHLRVGESLKIPG